MGGLASTPCAIVLLANGPILTPEIFARGVAAFGSEFEYASDHPFEPPLTDPAYAGFVFGRAARLQAFRRSGDFALLSPGIAAELAE